LSWLLEKLTTRGHGIGKQRVVILFAEAMEIEKSCTNQIDGGGFGLLVRDVVVIDQESLTAEIIGKFFNWMVVLDPVYCLASL